MRRGPWRWRLEVARSAELRGRLSSKRVLLLEFDAWLGLDLVTADPPTAMAQESDPEIDALVAETRKGREGRRTGPKPTGFAMQLAERGIEILDAKGGSRWRRR